MLPAANSMPDTYSGEGTTGIQTHSVLLPAGSAVPDLTKVDGPARLQQKQVPLPLVSASPDTDSEGLTYLQSHPAKQPADSFNANVTSRKRMPQIGPSSVPLLQKKVNICIYY